MRPGRYTRIRTRWPSDPLIPPHQRCYTFAIAFTHSIFHTQQHSIHRFAECCHSNNLHFTSLHPTSNYINAYYTLHTHQRCLKPHFHSASPTSRFNTTSFQGLSLHSSSIHSNNHFFSQINSYFTLGLRGWAKRKGFKYNTTRMTKNLPILLLSLFSIHFLNIYPFLFHSLFLSLFLSHTSIYLQFLILAFTLHSQFTTTTLYSIHRLLTNQTHITNTTPVR